MRTFYNPWTTIFGVAIVIVGLAAFAVLCNLVLPALLRRARDKAVQHPVRAFLVGLVNVLFVGVIAFMLLSLRAVTFRSLGFIVATLLLTFIAIGVAAIALTLGERLSAAASPTRQMLHGILTLELAALLPFVGWIVVSLIGASTGLGAVILALFQRKTLTNESTT